MENSPDHLVVVATEAIRKSRNAHKIIAAIEKIYSVRLFVLSGQQEAEFIAQGLKCDPQIYNQTSIQAFEVFDPISMTAIFLPVGRLIKE